MDKEIEINIAETRVKRYKQYRRKIKSDYYNFVKKNSKNDEIKKIEKSIGKINKDLIINDFSSRLFLDFSSNWTNDDGYVVQIKNYLDIVKVNKFNELLSKVDSIKNDIDMEPSFDMKGNLSLVWYKQDPKYFELERIREWLQFMIKEKEQIISNVKEKIFSFKDAFYRTSDPETIASIMPSNIKFTKIAGSDKNKKMFSIFLWSFFGFAFLSILFLVLFLVIK